MYGHSASYSFRLACMIVCLLAGWAKTYAQTPQVSVSSAAAEQPASPPRTDMLALNTAKKAPPKGKTPHLPHANAKIESLIVKYARAYNLPVQFVRRLVERESKGNPAARNGPYWGLTQMTYATAKAMGYRGPKAGLLNPETNLRYGIKYLAGAYIVAGRNEDLAIRYYAKGYHNEAKRKGLLEKSGLRPGPNSLKTAFP